MKKLTFIITLFFCTTCLFSQEFKVDPRLRAVAQKVYSKKVYSLNIFVDNTASKSTSDVQEIISHINSIYFQAKINFQIYSITTGKENYNPSGNLHNSIRTLKNDYADISIYITGSHSGSTIGVARRYSSVLIVDLSLQRSNKACSGVVAHEIGHIFGLVHGENTSYIMCRNSNQDYCNKFTKENLKRLIDF